MAASTQWAYAYEATANIGGLQTLVNFKIAEDSASVKFTNMKSPRSTNGKPHQESGTNVLVTTFECEVVVDKGAITLLSTGSKIDGVSASFPDGRTRSGSLNINHQEFMGAAEGGFQYRLSGEFTGATGA